MVTLEDNAIEQEHQMLRNVDANFTPLNAQDKTLNRGDQADQSSQRNPSNYA